MTPNILEAMKWFAPDLKGSPQAYEFTWVDIGDVDIRDYKAAAKQISEGVLPEVLSTALLPKDLPMPFEMVGVVATHMAGTGAAVTMVYTYHRLGNDMQVIVRHPTRRQLIMTQKGEMSEKVQQNTGDKDLWFDGDLIEMASKFPKYKGMSDQEVVREFIEMARKTYAMMFAKLMEKGTSVKSYQPLPNPANEKRIRKGKKPIFDWKVIDVTATHNTSESSAPTGRSHASPRRHVRRGHQRRLANGKTIWIKQMMVGRIEFGYIHHSYTTKEKANETKCA